MRRLDEILGELSVESLLARGLFKPYEGDDLCVLCCGRRWVETADGKQTCPECRGFGAKPSPICDACKGLGWVYKRVEFPDPEFGKAFPCRACNKGRSITALQVQSKIGVPVSYTQYSLDTFEGVARSQSQYDALLAARTVVAGEVNGLFLYGPAGTGKTGLAISVLRAIRMPRRYFINWRKYLADLRSTYDSKALVEERDVKGMIAGMDVLVLDEFGGSGQATEWQADVALELWEDRWNSGGTTIATSNISPTEIVAHFGDVRGSAILSRIQGLCLVKEMSGRDLRARGDNG